MNLAQGKLTRNKTIRNQYPVLNEADAGHRDHYKNGNEEATNWTTPLRTTQSVVDVGQNCTETPKETQAL